MSEAIRPTDDGILRVIADLERRVTAFERLPWGVASITTRHIGRLPAAQIARGSNQTIANSTSVAIAFDQETIDFNTMHDSAVNNTRLVATTAGVYCIAGGFWIAPSAGGTQRIATLRRGGTESIADHNAVPHATAARRLNVAAVRYLAAGDYIELTAFQDSGGNLDVQFVAGISPRLAMAWLGR